MQENRKQFLDSILKKIEVDLQNAAEYEYCIRMLEAQKQRSYNKRCLSVNQLAPEILSMIFSHLHDAASIVTAQKVCQLWRSIYHDNHTWKQVCKKKSYFSFIPRFQLLRLTNTAENGSAEKIQKQPSLFPWRHIYMSNYLTWRNWMSGKCQVTSIKKDDAGIAFDFDDHNAISMKRGEPVKMWNLSTGDCNLRLQHGQGGITTVKFNKLYIAAGFVDGSIRIWDIKQSRWSLTLLGHTDEIGALHLMDNDVLVSGSEDNSLRVWDLVSGYGKCILSGHSDSITSIHSFGNYIVSGSADGTVKVWALQTGQCIRTLTGHDGPVFCVQMNGHLVASGGQDALIRIWDWKIGKSTKILKGHHSGVVSLQFDQSKLVSGSADKTLKVWSVATGYCLYSLLQHTSSIWNVKFNKSQIISSSFDNSLLVWDFSHGNDSAIDVQE